MDDIKRIYSLLLHSEGLKVREISHELDLDKFYVAEIMFSPENIPYWYQNDNSLWFAKEGALQIEEPKKKDELVTPAERPLKFNIDKFLQREISDSLRIYLNQIPRFRLYTNDELLELIRRYRAGDRTAFELLVKSQQRFVANIAFIYRNRGASLEDIIQEGNIGLFRAIERFDESQYRSFSNFAKAWIMQAISFSMTNMPFMLKIPTNLLGLHRKVCRYKDKYEQINGIPPSVEAIKIDENTAIDKLAMIDDLPDDLRDLTVIYEDLDNFECPKSAIERFEDIEYNRYKANVLLKSLPTRAKDILESYFGIGCVQKSLEQIGIKHNLTRERVRQILVKMILILRERAKKNDAPIFVEKVLSPEKEAFLKEMGRLKPEVPKTETPSRTFEITRKTTIRQSKRSVIESHTFDLKTPLYELVQLKILTKKECKHCHKKRLMTIGDVKEIVRHYQLTPYSNRFTQYTLDIWFRILRLVE